MKFNMKVLTIKQPWATLIIQGDKRFEFRSWKTKYRGELLIHAGKGIDKEAVKRLEKYLPKELPIGKILGKVTLVDCIKMSPDFKEKLLKENSEIYTKSSLYLQVHIFQLYKVLYKKRVTIAFHNNSNSYIF